MNISLAEIRSTVSLASNGTFLAYVESDNAQRTVVYTSPQRSGHDGGFLAIPSINQKILVCKPTPRDPWFYLNTVWTNPEGYTDGNPIEDDNVHPIDTLDDRLYKARGVPMRTTIATDGGHRLLLSDEYNPKYFNKRLELRSSVGKRVKFLDSPEQDCIYIVNEHRDGIKITSEPDVTSAAQSIEVESRGPQKYICRESQIDMWVTEGRDLNLINNSTGIYENPLDLGKFGNVNLESMHRDINIRTRSQSGNIFIQTLGVDPLTNTLPNPGDPATFGSDLYPDKPQSIVIQCGGLNKSANQEGKCVVMINSTGRIELNALDGDIDIMAHKGDLNLGAAGKVNILSNGTPGGVNVDATVGNIHLNSGFAQQNATLGSKLGSVFFLPLDSYANKGVY